MLDLLLIVAGAVLTIHGAGILTDGAAATARRMGVPQIVVGMTIVGLGTSMPEFVISFVSAVKGAADMAVGNVVGSNIFNSTLTVGIAALAAPIIISRSTVKKDIPFSVGAALLLTVLCLDGCISRADSGILLAAFVAFMAYTMTMARRGAPDDGGEDGCPPLSVPRCLFFVFAGLCELIVGGNLFVAGATGMARALNVSDAVIGLTIVAGGTSLPELATSVVAARKGQSAIAIGNVIGSNVFNILMIVGVTGIVTPLRITGITPVDFAVMDVGIVLLWLMSYTKYTVERWEGMTLAAIFFCYMGWLLHGIM